LAFQFYFRSSTDKVLDISGVDQSSVEGFWLLQAHYSTEDMEAEVNALKEKFEVAENILFMKQQPS